MCATSSSEGAGASSEHECPNIDLGKETSSGDSPATDLADRVQYTWRRTGKTLI